MLFFSMCFHFKGEKKAHDEKYWDLIEADLFWKKKTQKTDAFIANYLSIF